MATVNCPPDIYPKITLFSDSLNVIQSLTSPLLKIRPIPVNVMYTNIIRSPLIITYVGISSHIGIRGNERADHLANSATSLLHIDLSIFTFHRKLKKVKPHITDYMNSLRQEDWTLSNKDDIFHSIVPLIRPVKLKSQSLDYHINLDRILSSYHSNGLSKTCKIP